MDQIFMWIGYLTAGSVAARGVIMALRPVAALIPGDKDDQALNAAERGLDALDRLLAGFAPGAFKRGAK